MMMTDLVLIFVNFMLSFKGGIFFCHPGRCSHKLSENPTVWLVGLRFGREDNATVKPAQQNHLRGWQLGLRERSTGPEAG